MEIIRAGTKVVFRAHAGQVGTDTAEFFILTSDMDEDELSHHAHDFGIDHAESYGVYPACYASEEDLAEDEENGGDSYNDNIEGWFEIYDAKEHDGLRCGNDTKFTEI
jgi:hypothetical protein